jgi:hypothetical protein
MRKNTLLTCLMLVGAVFASALAQNEKAPQRIVFARGATTAHATGYLCGLHDSASFVYERAPASTCATAGGFLCRNI